MNTQYINLNMVPSGVLPVLYVSQYDVGRPLGAVVYDGSAEMNLDDYTVTIEATRTDGTSITAAVTTDGNIGAFVTTATMTNKDDLYPVQLVIVDGDSNRVASLPFMMRVVKAAMDENSESIEEDASLYQQYNATAQALIASVKADLNAEEAARRSAVAAEAAARAAADTTLQNNINAEASARANQDAVLSARMDTFASLPSGSTSGNAELLDIRVGANSFTYPSAGDSVRRQVSDINSALIDSMTIEPFVWVENGFNFETGAVYTATNRIRTGIIPDNIEVISPLAGYAFAILAYTTDSLDSYMGVWDGMTWVKNTTSTTTYSAHPIALVYLRKTYGYYFRLVAKRTDNADLAVADGENINLLVWTDKNLNGFDKLADAGTVGMIFDNELETKANLRLCTVGTISVNDGLDRTSTTRIRMDKMRAIADIYKITTISDYEFMLLCYASDGTYLGVWTGAAITVGVVSWRTEAVMHDLDSDATMFRVMVRHSDDSAMTFDDYVGCLFTYYKNPVVEDNKNSLSDIISTFSDNYVVFKTEEGTGSLTKGAINGSGANADTTVYLNTSFRTEGFNDLSGAEYIMSEVVQTTPTAYYHYVVFYDDTFTFLSRTGGAALASVNAKVPSNAKYYRISLTSFKSSSMTGDNITSYTCMLAVENRGSASPQNKWYVLGDSISAGYYSMLTADVPSGVTPAISYEDGTCALWDATLTHNYWGYANKWHMKRDLVGKAYPGQGYLRTASNSQNGVYVVTHNDFSDAGLITVAWGFNDWHYDMTRGDHTLIDASVPYPGANYDTTQITTINQAIWFCLGELIRQAPNAKIVVQTPMNGWRYGGDWVSDWGIGYAMSNSGKLSDIHDDIVYWANYYGLQILEMTYNNSIVNRRNIKDTIIDGSHPSDAAHQQLGRHVAIALKYI